MENVNDDDMIMVASPNGRIYLVNRHTGEIRWNAETGKGALYLSYRRDDDVQDYLDLMPQEDSDEIKWLENNLNIYHFKPKTTPKLIPVNNRKEILQDCEDLYHDKLTTVDETEKVYHFDRMTGHNLADSTPDTFRVRRVDFYINRPGWSLKMARIMAWFPGGEDKDDMKLLETCEVYHSRTSHKYIKVCNQFNLHPLPYDSFLNKLIVDKEFLSYLVNANRKFVSHHEVTVGEHNVGKHNITIHEGTWDGLDCIVKKVDRKDGLEETNRMLKMIQRSGFHENLVNFYGRETDGESEFFAFEKCGITLHDYVKQNPHNEMSKTAVKIMSGLAQGVKHLHARGVAHLNLNPHNILVNSDDTIKICGLGNSKLLSEVTDGQLRDLHYLAHIILFIISDGRHNVEDVDVAPKTLHRQIVDLPYISGLKLQETNIEALDLCDKLGILSPSQTSQITSSEYLEKHPHFCSSHERLGFLKDISDHLCDGVPDSSLIADLQDQTRYSVVVPTGSWFQVLGGTGPNTVLEGMGYKTGSKKYTDHDLISLIRFVRNVVNHMEGFKKQPDQNLQTLLFQELGRNEIEWECNLRKKFPKLYNEVSQTLLFQELGITLKI